MASLSLGKLPLALALTREPPGEEPVSYTAAHPITWDEFVQLDDRDLDCELIDGVLVTRTVAYDKHEGLFAWLFTLLSAYTTKQDVGAVRGSRTGLKIDENGGRIPDLIFVRKDNLGILQNEGVVGTPDLVIEILSPSDRRKQITERETDYRRIHVPEIVFIDQRKNEIRILRLAEREYHETLVSAGPLTFTTIPGLRIQAEWLFDESRPVPFDLLVEILR